MFVPYYKVLFHIHESLPTPAIRPKIRNRFSQRWFKMLSHETCSVAQLKQGPASSRIPVSISSHIPCSHWSTKHHLQLRRRSPSTLHSLDRRIIFSTFTPLIPMSSNSNKSSVIKSDHNDFCTMPFNAAHTAIISAILLPLAAALIDEHE